MPIKLKIELENLNSSIYRPGNLVTGNIIIVNQSPKSIKFEALDMDIIGKEFIQWEEKSLVDRLFGVFQLIFTKSLPPKAKIYEDGAYFINRTIPILGKSIINPGTEYHLPFQFTISNESPSSFKSDKFKAKVSYTISAKLIKNRRKASLLFRDDDSDNVTTLNVLGELDLNEYYVCCPTKIKKNSKNKNACFELHLPKQGYLPGEILPFVVKILQKPNSKRSQGLCTISLIRTEYLISPSIDKRSKLSTTIVAQKSFPQVSIWVDQLDIPFGLDLTNLGCSKYIRISYHLKVKAVGFKNFPLIPIVIGTIPVANNNNPRISVAEFNANIPAEISGMRRNHWDENGFTKLF